MIFGLFLILSISIVGYSLAILARKKGTGTENTKIFIVLICSMVTWVVITLLEDPAILKEGAIKSLVKIDYVIAPLMSYFFLLFCLSFPEKITGRASLKKALLFLPTSFFILLPSLGLVVGEVVVSDRVVNISAGKFYWWYTAYHFVYAGLAFLYLILKYRILKGFQKTQLLYVIIGIFLTTIFFISTNLLVPLIPRVAYFSKVGLYGIFFFLGFTTYAILRYRLMDIRVVIRRGTVELFTILTLVFLYAFLLFLISPVAQKAALIAVGTSFFIVALSIFRPLRTFYEKITNQYFFSELYQSEKILKGIAKKLTTIIESERLLVLIADTIFEALKPGKIGILIFNPERGIFELKKSINFKKENIPLLTKEDVFINYLFTSKEPLVLSEIKLQTMKEKDEKRKDNLKKVAKEMERMEVALALPLIVRDILSGVILLSKKMSEEPYSKEDISLLSSLSSQASIAIANAQLYDETKEKRDVLEKFYKVTVGRELKMAELKKEIERLRAEEKEETSD